MFTEYKHKYPLRTSCTYGVANEFVENIDSAEVGISLGWVVTNNCYIWPN